MTKVYLMVYSNATGGRDRVKAWANQESAVSHWRYDMPHSMYLVSDSTAQQLADSFLRFNGKQGRFLIVELSENRQGILPSGSWYLFRNKKHKPKTES